MPHQCKMCHPEHLYLFPIGECWTSHSVEYV
jgi:hypothetical protein